MHDWTEKYRPAALRDLIGNDQTISQLRRWATDWTIGTPKKRAVILSGKPGIGKTSAAHAIAHDLGWTIIELNASDARNEPVLRRIAGQGSANETFDDAGRYTPSNKGGHKLIILDEADSLVERGEQTVQDGTDYSDRGAKKTIITITKTTRQPLILIANDYYALTRAGGEPLKTLCLHLPFTLVTTNQITELLKRICHAEDITTDGKILTAIAARSKGDVRSAVNDLQAAALNRSTLDITALDVIGYRDRETIVFDALRDIFKARDTQTSRMSLRNADIDPETLLQWVAENIPREYLDPRDLAAAFDVVALADVFLGRVQRRQDYDLWAYAGDLLSAGVTSAKTHQYGNTSYAYPSWIREMKGSQPPRALRDAIATKLSKCTHASKRKVRDQLLPFFQRLYQADVAFARRMTASLDLTEAEARFLLGKYKEHLLAEILKEPETPSKQRPHEASQPEKKDVEEKRQPSLMDF